MREAGYVAVGIAYGLGLIAAGVLCAPFVWGLFAYYSLKKNNRPW